MSNPQTLANGWTILDDDHSLADGEHLRTSSVYFPWGYYNPFGSHESCFPYWLRGSTVMDVGAHIGSWSVPMSYAVGAEGCVISIEPDPELCECLRLNMAKCPSRSMVINAAALNQTGNVTFIRNMEARGCSNIDLESSVEESDWRIPVKVDSIKIDDLGLTDLSFIKMDIEGAEFLAVKGAEETIMSLRPVLFLETVFHAPHYYRSTLEQMYEWLVSKGYGLKFYPIGAGVPHDVLCLPL